MQKALEMRNVSVVKDGKTILDSIDLEVGADENVAIIGPNVACKTSLLNCFIGFY